MVGLAVSEMSYADDTGDSRGRSRKLLKKNLKIIYLKNVQE